MLLDAHNGGATRLSDLETIAVDDKVDPCHRTFALVIMSIVGAAGVEDAIVEVLGRTSMATSYDECDHIAINNQLFFITLTKRMGRSGRAKACIEVMLQRNRTWLRLTNNGSVIHDDAPGWEDTSKSWRLDDQDMHDVGEFARGVAHVVMECGMYHGRGLGGCMPKCESCSFQYSCLAAPKYTVRQAWNG